jgi:hypothetical protein
MAIGFYRTILINLIVFCGLVLFLELSYRTWLYFSSCDTVCHNIAFITKLDAFNRITDYGFTAPNQILGYSPADGTFKIREPGWNGATITIRQGVRVNPNFEPASAGGAILAVGDSFVFGDQVSDDETWPALLERRLNRRVVNGGVSGYGPVQGVLRAEQLLKVRAFSLVILSILVLEDLPRDKWVKGYGDFYRPAVIREDGRFRNTTVEESAKLISKNFVCAHPWIPEIFFWSHVAKLFFSGLGYDGRCANIKHPKAATVDEILEFVVERVAALPVDKVILLQYPRWSFEGISAGQAIDEARKICDAASRHGVPVIDTYNALKDKSPREIYIYGGWPHHSKGGNEIVAGLIARKIYSAGKLGLTHLRQCNLLDWQ